MHEDPYEYEILNDRGAFLHSARPKTIEEIQAYETLRYLLGRHRHRACIVGGVAAYPKATPTRAVAPSVD